jgi:hypothetical protein
MPHLAQRASVASDEENSLDPRNGLAEPGDGARQTCVVNSRNYLSGRPMV